MSISQRSVTQAVLPSAPSKQAVQNKAIWYTTVGRLLVEPPISWLSRLRGSTVATTLDAASQQMTEELCGLQMQLDRCAPQGYAAPIDWPA